ncbi:MAG: hypothetical protein WDZ76_07195 [Pseudohongiellaceae bacterium]
MQLLKPLSIIALMFPLATMAQELSPIQQKVADAMQAPWRTAAEQERDEDRDPVAAVEFMGLEDDMTVIEFLPAAQAYYTKILGPVLRDNGHLMVVDSESTFQRWEDWTQQDEFAMTHQVTFENNYNRNEGRYIPGELNFGVDTADMFLYIREYHNYSAEDNARINAEVFETLRPGGSYVIIDHTRRHMQEENGDTQRREDPVSVIHQVLGAGFEFDRWSDMFYQPADDLSQEVGRIPNMTDRFFFVFKKPE